MKKGGIEITAETMMVFVFLVIGVVVLLLIYSSLAGDSPTFANTITNKLLDSLLDFVA